MLGHRGVASSRVDASNLVTGQARSWEEAGLHTKVLRRSQLLAVHAISMQSREAGSPPLLVGHQVHHLELLHQHLQPPVQLPCDWLITADQEQQSWQPAGQWQQQQQQHEHTKTDMQQLTEQHQQLFSQQQTAVDVTHPADSSARQQLGQLADMEASLLPPEMQNQQQQQQPQQQQLWQQETQQICIQLHRQQEQQAQQRRQQHPQQQHSHSQNSPLQRPLHPPQQQQLQPAQRKRQQQQKQQLQTMLAQPQQLVQQQEALVSGRLQCPAVSHTQQQEAQQQQALCSLLQCSKTALQVLVAKEPRLLSTPVQQLQAMIQQLVLALRAPTSKITAVVRKQPSLLFVAPKSIPGKLQAAANVLRSPVAQCRRLALHLPQPLLLGEPQQLHHQYMAAATALRLSEAQTGSVILARPQLLVSSANALTAKLSHLQQQLHLTQQQAAHLVVNAPAVLQYSTGSVKEKIRSLQQLLGGIGTAHIRHLVLDEPRLLTRCPTDLQNKLDSLVQLLGVERNRVVSLLLARPALLTRSSAQVGRSFKALSVWKFEPAYKVEMIQEHPLLLRLSPLEVHGRCRWLRSLMMSDAWFHSTLRALPPKLLGVMLMHLPTSWQRLQYLTESGRTMESASIRIMDACQLKDDCFARKFPDYDKYKSWNAGQQQVCGPPWRAQAATEQQQQQQQQQKKQQG